MREAFRGHERAILAALGINWYGARKTSGHIRCPFPNHEDKNPSWRFDEKADGWICSCGSGGLVDAVERMGHAKGFKDCKRWIEERVNIAPQARQEPKQSRKPAPAIDGYQPATRRPALSQLRHSKHGDPGPVAFYQNADRSIAEIRARYDLGDGAKEVCPWTLVGGRWVMKQMPGPRPLYRLPALLKEPHKPVLFVEGEGAKAEQAHALFGDTHVITSCSGGALAAAGMDYAPLKGRSVVVWPDNDAPGRTYADTVCRLAMAAGAVEARIVDVPEDWPRGWDLGDEPPSDSVDLRDMLDCANAWEEEQPRTNGKLTSVGAAAVGDLAESAAADFLARVGATNGAAAVNGENVLPFAVPPEKKQPPAQKFKLTRFRDIKPVLSGQWLIKGLLPARGLCTVFGEPGCGKSFLTLDMMLHIAGGKSYMGRRTTQARVVYIAAEGQGGFRNRVVASGAALDLDETTQFDLIEVAPNLGVKGGDAAELIKAIEAQSEATDLPVGVIVVDTTSQTMGGENENLEGMATFIVNVSTISSHFKCLAVAVHHVGKSDTQTPRGWSGLHGANDAEIKVSGLENPHTAEIVKQKDGETGVAWRFDLTAVQIGEDEEDGQPVKTCFVQMGEMGKGVVEDKAARDKAPRRSIREFDAAFMDALADHGQDYRVDGDGPLVRAVYVHYVRPNFFRRWAVDEPDKTARQKKSSAAFRSTLKALPPRYHTRLDTAGEMIWRT